MEITPEMIAALKMVRKNMLVLKNEVSGLVKALETLDNGGLFAPVDEATGYDIDQEDRTPNGLDPAEWGDMAFGPRG